MAGLPKRKIAQMERFFADHEKRRRLHRMAQTKMNVEKPTVIHTTIAGKKRTIRLRHYERGAKANIEQLLKIHAEAVRRGEIKPRTYRLGPSPYVYADENVGVMDTIRGVGSDSLSLAMSFTGYKKGAKQFEKEASFMKKHPKLTLRKLQKMEMELYENMRFLSDEKKRFSFDLVGADNIIITDFDDRDGIFTVRLVDQVYLNSEAWAETKFVKKR